MKQAFLANLTKEFASQKIDVLFCMYILKEIRHTLIMKRKQKIASMLLYNFIGLTVAIGGWLWEVLIFMIKDRHFVNRGFLYGPYLPVYGTGAVVLSILFYHKKISVMITYAHLQTVDYPQHFYHSRLYAWLRQLIKKKYSCRKQLQPAQVIKHSKAILPQHNCLSFYPSRNGEQKSSPETTYRFFLLCLRIFFLSMFGGCLTEFGTGWLLWHVFHRKYWDYSGYPMNLSGYICLYSALGFGIFGTLWVTWAGPFFIRIWERLRFSIQILIIGLCDLIIVTDAIFSLMQPNSGENITFSLLFTPVLYLFAW